MNPLTWIYSAGVRELPAAWLGSYIFGITILALILVWVLWPVVRRLRYGTKEATPGDALNDDERETLVRDWLFEYGMSVQKAEDNTNLFQFSAEKRGGQQVWVSRPQKDSDFLHIWGIDTVDPVIYQNVADPRQVELAVRVELLRLNVQFELEGQPVNRIHQWRRVPFDESLTKEKFMDAYDAVVRGRILARSIYEQAMLATGNGGGAPLQAPAEHPEIENDEA